MRAFVVYYARRTTCTHVVRLRRTVCTSSVAVFDVQYTWYTVPVQYTVYDVQQYLRARRQSVLLRTPYDVPTARRRGSARQSTVQYSSTRTAVVQSAGLTPSCCWCAGAVAFLRACQLFSPAVFVCSSEYTSNYTRRTLDLPVHA